MKGEKRNEEKHTQTLYGFCNDHGGRADLNMDAGTLLTRLLKPLLSTI